MCGCVLCDVRVCVCDVCLYVCICVFINEMLLPVYSMLNNCYNLQHYQQTIILATEG